MLIEYLRKIKDLLEPVNFGRGMGNALFRG